MKIPNKGELQQMAFNYSSDICFNDFMKPNFFVNDTTLALDNLLRYRKNFLERM